MRRRFGREALERVAQPLVGGIYAADPEQLSLAATMPRFLEMERNQRSVIRSMWSDQRRRARRREAGSGARWSLFVTLADGMQELVDAVAGRLPENSIRLQRTGERGESESRRRKNGTSRLRRVNPSTPTPLSLRRRRSMRRRCSAPSPPSRPMSWAKSATLPRATVSLAYRCDDFPRAPDSFGFVVPAIEKRKIMACTFSSLKYPGRAPEGHLLLRAFVGGALQPEHFGADDATMEQNVRDELASLMGVTAKPILSRIWRHPNSMPQYHIGHDARIKRIESALNSFPTLALAGSAYHGVGIADCVRTGEEAAEKCHCPTLK